MRTRHEKKKPSKWYITVGRDNECRIFKSRAIPTLYTNPEVFFAYGPYECYKSAKNDADLHWYKV